MRKTKREYPKEVLEALERDRGIRIKDKQSEASNGGYLGGTYWNGEPCKARRVLIRVGDCPFPQGWFKGLEGTEMRAVEITYGSEVFYLADQDGNGWHKVTVEGGGPHWGHKSVTCAEVIKERTTFDSNDCHCANSKSNT